MSVLKDSDGNIAVSMKTIKALVQRLAFPKMSTNLIEPPVTLFRSAYIKIYQEVIAQVLITQVATKAPGPDKINFQILQMIGSLDHAQITCMVYHAI